MLASGARRVVAPRALVHTQKRFGGSLSKNKHIENWNNWRGDSERRFSFDAYFFKSLFAWGVVPFGAYYMLSTQERIQKNRRDSLPDNYFQ